MLAVPSIIPSAVVSPVDGPEGRRYRLSPGRHGAGAVVSPRTYEALQLMDGTRTLLELHAQLQRLGVKMRDPARLIDMVRALEAAGVVDVKHHFATLAPLRHACQGCGRSCEGHLVGPIDADEVRLLERRLLELRQDDRCIPEGPAAVELDIEGSAQWVLNFPAGACVFLAVDKRCRLHARWGPRAKPLPCRMFPWRMVRTETGTRMAISPRCYRAHQSYRSAAAATAESLLADWGVWRPPALVRGLDPGRPESLEPTPAYAENLADEKLVLGLLGRGPSLGEVLGALARSHHHTGCDDHFAQGVAVTIRRVATQAASGGNRGSRSELGQWVACLVHGAESFQPSEQPTWDDLPQPALDYVLHGLGSLVFTRDAMDFGSIRAGVLAYAMGAIAARWMCDSAALSNGQLDQFVGLMTTWLRLVVSPALRESVFPQPSACDELLAHCAQHHGRGWRG